MILKVTLLLCAAEVLASIPRRIPASARHMIRTLGLAAALALPLLAWLAPPVALPSGASFALNAAAGAAAGAAGSFDWMRWAWIAGALAMAARFAMGHARAASMVRAASRESAREGVEIRRAAAGVMPFTWGLLRPVVLLPVGESRAAVIGHELAHAHRRDHWWLLLSQAACGVYWFHPLVWWSARKASEDRERACDDLVLRRGEAPAGYAETLVAVAKSGVAAPAGAIAVAGQTPLEGRIRAILDPAVNRAAMTRRGAMAASAAAACFALLVAAPVAAQKVYKVGEDGATPPRVKSKVEPSYTQEAREAKISGSVKLSLEIDEKGLPQRVKVVAPLDPGLDVQAIRAVEQWRFEPGKIEGKPVRVAANVEVNFRLL